MYAGTNVVNALAVRANPTGVVMESWKALEVDRLGTWGSRDRQD